MSAQGYLPSSTIPSSLFPRCIFLIGSYGIVDFVYWCFVCLILLALAFPDCSLYYFYCLYMFNDLRVLFLVPFVLIERV